MINDFNNLYDNFVDWEIDFNYFIENTIKDEHARTETTTILKNARGIFLPYTPEQVDDTPQIKKGEPQFQLFVRKNLQLLINQTVEIENEQYVIKIKKPSGVATNFDSYILLYATSTAN